MNLRISIVLVMLLTGMPLFAQIIGSIEDTDNKEPLEYATVALFTAADSALVTGSITDLNGDFRLSGIGAGLYYLESSFLGYQTRRIGPVRISLKNELLDLGTIGLTLSQNQLQEVVVNGERPLVVNRIDKQVFDAKSFQNALGGAATDIIKNLPAVSMNALGELSVRGSTGFTLLLNGSPIQGNPMDFLNQIPANAIKSIELITAPSAKFDPEGKAGILNVITSKELAAGNYTQINVRGGLPSIETYGNAEPHQRYGLDATYNSRKGPWNLSLGGSFQHNDRGGQRIGDVYTIIRDTLTQFPSAGERSFDEINYSGRFTLDFTPDTTSTYSLGFYAGKRSQDRTADIVYFDNHALIPAEISGNRLYTFQYYNENLRIRRGDFFLGSFDFSQRFKNSGRLSTSLLYEYTLLGGPTTNRNLGYPNTDIVYQDEYNTNDNPLNGVRLTVDYAFKPLTIGSVEAGYQYRLLDHRGDFVYERKNNQTGIFELVPEFSSEVDLIRHLHSGYAQISGSKSKWEYNGGIRLEYMYREFDLRDKTGSIDTTYVYDYFKLFPSAALQYSLSERTKLKGAYSKRVERTTTFKMNPFPEREHSETLEQGDPELRPEFIDLIEIGINSTLKGRQSFAASVYYRNIENLVNRVNTIYNDTILNRIYSNVGTGKALGLELGLQLKPVKDWSNFIGVNLYDYRITGEFDNRSIASKSLLYSINLNSTFAFSKTASAQFTFNYLSPRNTAQGEDSRFYSPNLTLKKTFLDNRITATLQWQHIDLGLLNTNEQSITTFRPGEFYTTTNYIYEVDMILFNLSYSLNSNRNNSRFIESVFGKQEF